MLSDTEIFHLQRSIEFHRKKQVDEIKTRDNEILKLKNDNQSYQSVISKHIEQHGQTKEKFVKLLNEYEHKDSLYEQEKLKNNELVPQMLLIENELKICKQDKEHLRTKLLESEGLLISASQHRNRIQELESNISHYKEQVRLLGDAKSALDNQLMLNNRELDSYKHKYNSHENRHEILQKEKINLIDELNEIKQKTMKKNTSNIELIEEQKREIITLKDLLVIEKNNSMKNESKKEVIFVFIFYLVLLSVCIF